MMAAGVVMDIIGKVMGAKEARRVADIMRNLPEYQKVKVGEEQQATVEDNLRVLPQASELASKANLANVTSAQQMYRQMIPGYDRMMQQASGLISDQMSGRMFGSDVAMSLAKSAGKALGGGFAGSGMWKNLSARDLGMQTYQLTQQGLTNAMNWLQTQRSMAPQPLSVQSMFMTPSERVGIAIQQNQLEYESKMRKALGMTTPGETGYWSQTLIKTGGQLMGMGGMMGGFGGGGGGGTPVPETEGAGAYTNFYSFGSPQGPGQGTGE